MNMMLLDCYSFNNRKANIYQIREDFYILELYMDGVMNNKLSLVNLSEAKIIANGWIDGRDSKLLNENA